MTRFVEWVKELDRVLNHGYAINHFDMGLTYAELKSYFSAGDTPQATCDQLGDKYELIPRSTWS